MITRHIDLFSYKDTLYYPKDEKQTIHLLEETHDII